MKKVCVAKTAIDYIACLRQIATSDETLKKELHPDFIVISEIIHISTNLEKSMRNCSLFWQTLFKAETYFERKKVQLFPEEQRSAKIHLRRGLYLYLLFLVESYV